MAYEEKLTDRMVINKLTRAQYDEALGKGEISDTELYFVTDEQGVECVTDESGDSALSDGAYVVSIKDLANLVAYAKEQGWIK